MSSSAILASATTPPFDRDSASERDRVGPHAGGLGTFVLGCYRKVCREGVARSIVHDIEARTHRIDAEGSVRERSHCRRQGLDAQPTERSASYSRESVDAPAGDGFVDVKAGRIHERERRSRNWDIGSGQPKVKDCLIDGPINMKLGAA